MQNLLKESILGFSISYQGVDNMLDMRRSHLIKAGFKCLICMTLINSCPTRLSSREQRNIAERCASSIMIEPMQYVDPTLLSTYLTDALQLVIKICWPQPSRSYCERKSPKRTEGNVDIFTFDYTFQICSIHQQESR